VTGACKAKRDLRTILKYAWEVTVWRLVLRIKQKEGTMVLRNVESYWPSITAYTSEKI